MNLNRGVRFQRARATLNVTQVGTWTAADSTHGSGEDEVIKSVESGFYSAGAMEAVVNLLSRRPGTEPQREFW